MEDAVYAAGRYHQEAEQIHLSTSVLYLGEPNILLIYFSPRKNRICDLHCLKRLWQALSTLTKYLEESENWYNICSKAAMSEGSRHYLLALRSWLLMRYLVQRQGWDLSCPLQCLTGLLTEVKYQVPWVWCSKTFLTSQNNSVPILAFVGDLQA